MPSKRILEKPYSRYSRTMKDIWCPLPIQTVRNKPIPSETEPAELVVVIIIRVFSFAILSLCNCLKNSPVVRMVVVGGFRSITLRSRILSSMESKQCVATLGVFCTILCLCLILAYIRYNMLFSHQLHNDPNSIYCFETPSVYQGFIPFNFT